MHRTNRTTTRRLILHTSLLLSLAVAVLFALGMTMEEVGAEKSPGSYQNAFTAACRDHGGTPKRVRSRVVKCTLADGTVIECDFNFNPPSCTKDLMPLPSSPVTDPFAPPSDGNEQPAGGGTNAGGGAGVGPTGVAEQPLEPGGGGVVLTAYDDGTDDRATHHGTHHRQGHGKGRKG